MTTEEKNNLISYLKKYKKLDKDINTICTLTIIFTVTNLIFLATDQNIWALSNFILIIILCTTSFIISHNQKQLSENIFLLLKDYKVITIYEHITELYNKESIVQAAKLNKTLNLRINYNTSISKELIAENTSAIDLLKKHPDLNTIKKIQTTYTINKLILDYQKDIIKICNNNIPDPYIKYETTEPIGKAKLKHKEDSKHDKI